MDNTSGKKLILAVIAIAFPVFIATTGYRIVAGENENKQSNEKMASSSDKGSAANSSRWFADPKRGWIKRGWIRKDEREEQKKRGGEAKDRGENSTAENASSVIWEY
jgi:hypothetical protein